MEPDNEVKVSPSVGKSSVRNYKAISFAIVVVFSSILFGLGGYYLGSQKAKCTTNTVASEDSQTNQSSSQLVKEKDESNRYCPNVQDQARQNKFLEHLSTALTAYGATLYDKFHVLDNGLQTFHERYSFIYNGESYYASISIFRNFSGKEIETGYEGFDPVTRKFDKEAKAWLDLNKGLHRAEMWRNLGYSLQEVTVKEIGERKYVVFDSQFPPAGTVSRNYFIYGEKVGNLIYFSLESYHDSDVYKVESYPDNFQNFIDEVEKAVAGI